MNETMAEKQERQISMSYNFRSYHSLQTMITPWLTYFQNFR